LAPDNNIKKAMRRVLAVLCAAVLGYSSAPAAEIHLSHFGQVMVSVPWIIALEQDLFRKNGVDVTDVITSQGGGTTLRNMLAGGVPFGDAAIGATVTGFAAGLIRLWGEHHQCCGQRLAVLADLGEILRDVVGGKFGTTPRPHPRLRRKCFCGTGIAPACTQVPLGVGAAVAALNSGAVNTAYMYEPLQSVRPSTARSPGIDVCRTLSQRYRLPGFIEKERTSCAHHADTSKPSISSTLSGSAQQWPRMVNVDLPSGRALVGW
jgi:NitT/TauT family transport system substrate-binding protein